MKFTLSVYLMRDYFVSGSKEISYYMMIENASLDARFLLTLRVTRYIYPID